MKAAPALAPSARGLRLAIVRSLFNATVVDGLLAGARQTLLELGLARNALTVIDVPGAFELPLAARYAAESGHFDAIVALGAVVRGETDHYEHIARTAAAGLAEVSLRWGVPVGFGVLTVADGAQALARSAPGPANKGGEAARAAVAMAQLTRRLGRRAPAALRRRGGDTGSPGRRRGRAPSRAAKS